MAVRCPAWRWPEELEERGPTEDPSILLIGAAQMGDVSMQIVAIRVDATLRWSPDYRRDVAEDTYRDREFDGMLETTLENIQSVATALGELMGNGRLSVVELPTGPYRVWVMPNSVG